MSSSLIEGFGLKRTAGKQTSPNSRFQLSTYRKLGAVLAGLVVLQTLQK